jgi:cytochrome P450
VIERDVTHVVNCQEVEDELITTIMGGHETTASSLSFLVYLLVTHPDKLKLVMDELQRIRAGRAGSKDDVEWTFEDLLQMDYLHNVIKEGLRLYPRYEPRSKHSAQCIARAGSHRSASCRPYGGSPSARQS